MVIIQAHSDDFDFSLSGEALIAQKSGAKIIILTVTDCEADTYAYDYGLSLELFEADAVSYGNVVAPNNEAYIRIWYSHNCGVFRLHNMTERYANFGFTSIIPSVKVPDGCWKYSSSIQEAYINAVQEELLTKIQSEISNDTHVTFYIQDILVNEHGDHVIAGRIGDYIYDAINIQSKSKFQFYVYTNSKTLVAGYHLIDVSSVYNAKVVLYDSIFEAKQPNLVTYLTSIMKNPHVEDKYFFISEIRR